MVRKIGFFPIMFATFATTVAFTLSFHDIVEARAVDEVAHLALAR